MTQTNIDGAAPSKSNSELTVAAVAGYSGGANPHLASSPSFYAHELGAFFKASGRTEPRDVRMGRGYSIRANDLRFKITNAGQRGGSTFERVE
jgi:hypothetical protein